MRQCAWRPLARPTGMAAVAPCEYGTWDRRCGRLAIPLRRTAGAPTGARPVGELLEDRALGPVVAVAALGEVEAGSMSIR